jgi:ring-1,2-phenylacetyl-CoA epoxidase subunit PaaC
MKEKNLFTYCLHLGDNALILAQRNSEWCAHGPVLEQDIAITNISLDLLGQARNFYQYAANLHNDSDSETKDSLSSLVPRLWKMFDRGLSEDDIAFLREERQFLNLLICELPNGDWAKTTLRQFFFSAYQYFLFAQLVQSSSDNQVVAIAEKSLKEITYHLRWSSEWVIRLGDGTEKSHKKITKALDELWPFTGEFFLPTSYEPEFVTGPGIKDKWLQKVTEVLTEATLNMPAITGTQKGGKEGKHTEYMGYILPELQYIQRAFPNSVW